MIEKNREYRLDNMGRSKVNALRDWFEENLPNSSATVSKVLPITDETIVVSVTEIGDKTDSRFFKKDVTVYVCKILDDSDGWAFKVVV